MVLLKTNSLVYAFMCNRTLSIVIQNNKLNLAKESLTIYRIVCAIHALHRNSIVHRDIKPYILFDQDFNAFLSDFNLACPLGGETFLYCIGAFCYRAPEHNMHSIISRYNYRD